MFYNILKSKQREPESDTLIAINTYFFRNIQIA